MNRPHVTSSAAASKKALTARPAVVGVGLSTDSRSRCLSAFRVVAKNPSACARSGHERERARKVPAGSQAPITTRSHHVSLAVPSAPARRGSPLEPVCWLGRSSGGRTGEHPLHEVARQDIGVLVMHVEKADAVIEPGPVEHGLLDHYDMEAVRVGVHH